MADSSALQTTTSLRPAQYVKTVSYPGTSVEAHYLPQDWKEKEKGKTRQQKAEDVIYTLNHSITCLGVTDTFGLVGAANAVGALNKFLNKNLNTKLATKFNVAHEHNNGYGAFQWMWDKVTGKHKDAAYDAEWHVKEDTRIKEHHEEHSHGSCSHGPDGHKHDHSHPTGKEVIHPDPAPKLTPKSGTKDALKKMFVVSKKWILAEAVGDLGAVPVTIYLQRHAPGFMNTLRKGMEPVIGKQFERNAHRSAVNWGAKQGFDADSQEVKERSHELYEYEMSHMPQMAVWTVTSVAMNFGAMHLFHKLDPRGFEKTGLMEFGKVKGLGALFTAGVVLGVRGMTPGGAHWWDRNVGKHIVIPLTKGVGKLVGVKSEDVDAFQQKRIEMGKEGHSHFGVGGDSQPANENVPSTKVQKSSEESRSVERLQPMQDIANAV